MAQRYEDDDRHMRSYRSDQDTRGQRSSNRDDFREGSWQGRSSGRDDYDRPFDRPFGRADESRGSRGRWAEDDYGMSRGSQGGRQAYGRGTEDRDISRSGRDFDEDRDERIYGRGYSGQQRMGAAQDPSRRYGNEYFGDDGRQGASFPDQSDFRQGTSGALGRGMGRDHHYHNWRDRQLQSYDDDFKAFNEEGQKKFDTEFEEWRKNRTSGSTGQGGNTSASGSGRTGETGSRDETTSGNKKG